jgi:hypothetical protein
MKESERASLNRMMLLRRIGYAWLPLLGFAAAMVAAVGYREWLMLGVAITLFVLAGVFNILYVFSPCPRCHGFFHSLPASGLHLMWPSRRCRHCGLDTAGEQT